MGLGYNGWVVVIITGWIVITADYVWLQRIVCYKRVDFCGYTGWFVATADGLWLQRMVCGYHGRVVVTTEGFWCCMDGLWLQRMGFCADGFGYKGWFIVINTGWVVITMDCLVTADGML